MTKTEIKHEAQDAVMHAAVNSLYAIADRTDLTDGDRSEMNDAAIKQLRRIEKLLGYTPGSWSF